MTAASRARPRRRGAVLENAILDATVAELAEVGYAALTVEGVARRAGAGKYSLYRRWPDKAALAMAAAYHLHDDEPVPTTGPLRADLIAWLRQGADRMAGPAGEIYRGLLSESLVSQDRPTPGLLSRGRGVTALTRILDAARDRGEPVVDAPAGQAMQAPQALLRIDFLTRGAPVADALIEAIVDEVALPLLTRRTPGSRPPEPIPPDRVGAGPIV